MCIEDVMIGRYTTGNMKFVPTDAAGSQLIGQSPTRRVLILFSHTATAYTVRPVEDVTGRALFTVSAGDSPLILNSDDVGGIVRQPLFVAAGASIDVTVYEGFFDPVEFGER